MDSKRRVNKNRNSSNIKRKKRKRKLKKAPVIILCLILVGLLTLIISSFNFYSLYKKGGIKANKDEIAKDINIKIEPNTSPKEISKALKDAGIVDNSFLFYHKAKKDGVTKNFQAGDFSLSTNMTYDVLIETLQNAKKPDGLKLLIKEGQTQEDIAKTLDSQGIISYEDFMNACNTGSFDYPFLKDLPQDEARKNKLEGYLYPDTYYLSEQETAESIINKLLTRFNELYTEDLVKKATELKLTTDKVVTIASLIEREVKFKPEKTKVASVIFNRLNKNMKLQIDATVLYAKNEHSDRTLIEDTKIQSPYNTYYINGLPIGPISNPSIDTIKAVLNAENTKYLYYVLKDDTTGEHFFTDDYDEFLKAKNKYTKKFN